MSDGPEEIEIDRLRLAAFQTNSNEDKAAYYLAVSKWFQDRHYRPQPTATTTEVSEAMVERACVELIRHDPNWSQFHWPSDEPRKVKYQSGWSRMSSPVWGEHLASIRTRARAALEAALSTAPSGDGDTLASKDTALAEIRAELERERELKDHARKCCDTAETALVKVRKALEDLASAKALKGVRELVAGWNGEYRIDGPYDRHPSEIGATMPPTNCGAVYQLDAAMIAAHHVLFDTRHASRALSQDGEERS